MAIEIKSEEYLMTKEVTKKMNITRQTLLNWIKKHNIPYKSVGGRKYFKAKDIEALFD